MPRRLRYFVIPATLALVAMVGGAWAQTSSSVTDGIYTATQAGRGQDAFMQNCATCHGSGLTGNGEAPALVGGEFISNWAGLTVGDLFDRIHSTMPQDNPGKLSRPAYADILAFILKTNGYPAGQKELDNRSPFLKAIAFIPPHPAGGK